MALQYRNNPVSPYGQGMYSRPPTVPIPPTAPPAPIPPTVAPPAASVLAPVASVLAPVAAFLGAFFGFAEPAGDPNELSNFKGKEPNSGNRSGKPPFEGGQMTGIEYAIQFKTTYSDGATRYGMGSAYGASEPWTDAETRQQGIKLNGAINGSFALVDGGNRTWYITYNGVYIGYFLTNIFQGTPTSISVYKVLRTDGQPDTGGNPPSTEPSRPSGYTGSPNEQDRNKSPFPSPNNPSNSPVKTPKPTGTGGFAPSLPSSLAPSFSPSQTPTQTPSTTPKAPTTPPQTQPPNTNPSDPKKDKPTPPFIPPKTPTNDDLRKDLTALGALLAFMNGNLNQVKDNTSPDALKNAAKQGSCESLQSPSCTAQLKNDIKDPILNKQDALGKALLGTNQAAQDGILIGMVTKLNQIQDFAGKVYNASKLDKIYNFLTFFVTVHNAAMLSNSLITTLEDTLSQGLATFGIKDVDGNPINIQENVNKTTQQIISSIIGVQNYNTLSENWTKANNIFRSGANLLYNVRSLWDSARSLQEMTGANLGQLMNSLKREGVVSEKAYPAKCENPLMINSGMDRLQNLESAASHLNQIASTTYGITQTVAQLKDDKDNFDKALKEQPKKKGIENDAEKNDLAASKAASPSPVIATENLVKPD